MSVQATGLDLSQIDSTIRIQDDLFGHVNGTWLREHEIPHDKAGDSEALRLHELSLSQVRDIIEDLAHKQDAAATSSRARGEDTGAKIGALFNQFMDEDAIESAGAQPLEPILHEISELGDMRALTRYMGSHRAHVGIISLHVWADPNDPHVNSGRIYQAGLGLPDESYYREDTHAHVRAAYRDYLARLAELASLSGRPAMLPGSPADLADAVFAWETEIAQAHVDVVRARDAEKSNNPMGPDERAEAFPGFDWDAFIEGVGITPERARTLVICQPEYLRDVASAWASADERLVRTWLALHAIDAAAPYLSSEFTHAHFAFHGTTLSGIQHMRPRWKRAIALVERGLGEAIGEHYVARHFPPAAKERVESLVQALIDAYRDSITRLEWMSPHTREKALAKLEAFTPKLGYPSRWRDYSGLEISQDSLLDSVRNIDQHEHEFRVNKLGHAVDRDEWHMVPQMVNAYYNPSANEIVFPAAILQPPFFGIDADDSVNFGGIGAVIGHEIGHGFDDQGSKYSGDGTLESWWSESDRAEFETRTQALIDDYSAMSPRQLSDEHTVNGAFTIGENIGDLGGLSIALKAYIAKVGSQHAWAKGSDGYSGVQRLFIAWAVVWRAKFRDEEVRRRLATDPHSPAECRANGVVRHIDAFYEAFDVREGDAMYLAPERRVSIW